ncbi:MAG: Do family serine endopeptidase [Balneola sp.]
MNTTVKNIFGVAAAVLLLLGMNAWTGNDVTRSLPDYTSDNNITSAESRSVSSLLDLNNAIVDIAEKTNPAVVMITTEKVQEQRVMRNPFSQFFGNPYGQRDPETREYTQRGLGSGVIVSEDGYILTNNHVIEDVDEIKIQLFDGDEIEAELIGADPATDIAVLKVDMDDLPSVKLGDSESLKVGAFVLAIGSPLSQNLAHTVSFGIVSAKSRSIGLIDSGAGFEDFIQTDAAINPGNSGGAMIDMNGELVGINSAIASRSGGNDGIGFAIPINLAKRIMDDLIDDGEVSRGYLGLYFGGEVDRTMAKALGLSNARGIIVARVEEDGPSDKAGLQEQDVIVAINGQQVVDWNMFRSKIASMKPNDEVKLDIIRDGKEETLTVTLGERNLEEVASVTPKNEESMKEKLGFTVAELDENIRRQLQLDSSDEGVVVNRIEESSNAYDRGLRRGDVIITVKNQKVKTASEFYDELEELEEKGDEVVLLKIIRNNGNQFIAFELD